MTTNNTTTETVTTSTTTTEIKFKDDLVALSEKLAPLYTADTPAAALKLMDEAYFEHAPEGVTPESYVLHQNYQHLFNNAATDAAKAAVVDMLKADPKLEAVSVSAKIHGKDNFEASFKRHGTSRNPATGEVSNYTGSIAVARVNVVSNRTKAESSAIKASFRSLAEAAGL